MTARNISLLNATYSSVPAVQLPISGGGTATFTEITDTTATASDVATGKYFYTSAGVKTAGTNSGGGDDFVVRFSWDSVHEVWTPDRTLTEVHDALIAEKGVVGTAYKSGNGVQSELIIEDENPLMLIVRFLYTWYTICPNGNIFDEYVWDSNGFNLDYRVMPIISPNYETVTKTYTPTTSQQTETVTFDSNDYNGLQEVDITVNAMPSGTAGTPTATKGAVNNHSVSVTPSVTNTTGYITGSTKTGTAVTVSASELVSGDKSITENGNNIDVANYSTVSVNVSGGGGTVTVGTKTTTLANTASSISFTGLSGNPTSFVVTSSADIATNTNGVTGVVYDGTTLHGQTMTTQVTADSGFSKSYSSGTLTITATTAEFQANEYKLVYTYDGSSSAIHTADVQVGSGATSITFSSLSGRPIYWSCIFKSDFSTSSGYQRVIEVVNDGSSTYGMAMDSSAHAQTSWTATYSGGNLTISSSGTNNGGYFHQPGYYQLTYAVDDSAPVYQTKTVSPTTSQQTVTADNGYDALEEVIVNAMPTMALPSATSATSSGTSKATITPSSSVQYLNIPTGYNGTAQHYTISASGGGSSKNVQVLQSTSRVNASSLTKALGDLTVSKTGTYDIYWSGGRSNTSSSYTWGTRLYVDGSGYGTENTSWTNNCQSNHLSNVSLTANQKLSVYSRGRTGSYYTFVPMLVIIEV